MGMQAKNIPIPHGWWEQFVYMTGDWRRSCRSRRAAG